MTKHKFSSTDEEQIYLKIRMGVPRTRLAADYGCTIGTIKRIEERWKVRKMFSGALRRLDDDVLSALHWNDLHSIADIEKAAMEHKPVHNMGKAKLELINAIIPRSVTTISSPSVFGNSIKQYLLAFADEVDTERYRRTKEWAPREISTIRKTELMRAVPLEDAEVILEKIATYRNERNKK